MIPLAAPDWLHCAVVHPDQVLETRRARAVLADPYPLHALVEQSTHLALFLTGLQRGDTALIREGLHDVLVEPRRAPLIPGFTQVKAAALDHGALGASISGRSEEHTSELQSLMRISYAVFCLKKKNQHAT